MRLDWLGGRDGRVDYCGCLESNRPLHPTTQANPHYLCPITAVVQEAYGASWSHRGIPVSQAEYPHSENISLVQLFFERVHAWCGCWRSCLLRIAGRSLESHAIA